jgi:Tfp pilus assembly protein PilF
MRTKVATGAALLLLAAAQLRADEIECGSLQNHYGPFDYRTAQRSHIDVVEKHHFTSRVETLQGAMTGKIGGDIDYTLKVFPNHPRALLSMATLAEREKTNKPAGSQYTLDCWFDRAMRFQPGDGVVQVIYGITLLRQDKTREAIDRLESAVELLGDNANAYYNLGLAYFKTKDYDTALKYAHKAYAAGFPLPGLRNKLEQVGKWRD